MIFGTKIENFPVATDADLAAETVALYANLAPDTEQLIAGTAGASPYLRGLLQTQAAWLQTVLDEAPEIICEKVMQDAAGDADIASALRLAKKRTALVLALADLAGIWPLEKVTRALTNFADFAVQQAARAAIAMAFSDAEIASAPLAGMCVLAMGKMGAHELNYSSDIDLIFLFDDALWPKDEVPERRVQFVKATRSVIKILSEMRGDGYVFRTDVRLRPNPSVTPICVPMSNAAAYYGKEGRTWERSAFIKARPCAGDLVAGAKFLQSLEVFIWRKHLDFAAIRDIQDIQRQIHEHKGTGGAIDLLGHDMKLGRGGIREIEFFAQTRQLIAGGRDLALRCITTVEALEMLAAKDWIPTDVATRLIAAYRSHRRVEHRIQMLHDAQTHSIPKSPEQLLRLANLDGHATDGDFGAAILVSLEDVHSMSAELSDTNSEATEGVSANADQLKMFESWRDLPSFRHPVVLDIFDAMQPMFLKHLNAAPDPQGMLHNFDLFLSRLNKGVELFSLFEARPDILLLVMDFCALSSTLATRLAAEPKVLDGLAFDSFFTVLPNLPSYAEMLEHALTRANDLEDQLVIMRRWQAEQHFRIMVQQLRGAVRAERAAAAYSDLAEACLHLALEAVENDFASKHGRISGAVVAILAMGKLGSKEMTNQSDLDIIVVFDGPDEGESDGARPLDTRTYYARLTKALINGLSAQMTHGRLYEVDMRLRPSGRKGPVATAIKSFETYQRKEAWVWEHLALSRARVVGGDIEFGKRLAGLCRDILGGPHDADRVATEVQEMRDRLQANAPDAGNWPIKRGAGGLLDIELLAQACVLLGGATSQAPRHQLNEAAGAGLIQTQQAETLIDCHKFFTQIEHLKRLIFDIGFDLSKMPLAAGVVFLRETGMENLDALSEEIADRMGRCSDIIGRFLADLAPKTAHNDRATKGERDDGI